MPSFRWGMTLDPFVGFRWLQRELDRFAELPRLFGDGRRIGGGSYPPVNIYTGENDIVVQAELPGVAKGELDVSITGESLTIQGTKVPSAQEEHVRFLRRERGSGEFSRTIILPDRVEADKIAASLANGILTVTLPKSEAAKPKQISVQS